MSDNSVDLVIQGQDKLSPAAEEATQALIELGAQQLKLLQQQAEIENSKNLISAFKSQTRAVLEAKEAHEAKAKEVNRLAKAMAQAETPTNAQARAFERAKKAATASKKAYQDSLNALQKTTQAMNQAGLATRNLEAQQSNLARQAKITQKAIDEQAQAIKQAEEKLSSIKAIGNPTMAETFERTKESASALVGILGQAAAQSMSFEKSIGLIQTLLDAPTEQGMVNMADDLRAMAREYGISAVELADTARNVVSSGVQNEQDIKEIVRTATQLAIAGGMDTTNEAAKAVTTSLNAYKQGADGAALAADRMFQAVKLSSNVSLEDITQGMGNAASMASQLGIDMNEVYGAFAAITKNGVPAAQAWTQVEGILQKLIKLEPEGEKMAQKLGINFSASAIEAKGLIGLVQELRDAVTDATSGKQNATQLSRMFTDDEGFRGILAIVGGQNEVFTQAAQAMEKNSGALERAHQTMMDTASKDLQKFKQAWNDVLIQLGEVPTAFTPILNGLAAVVEGFNSLPTGVRQATVALVAFAALVPALKAAYSGLKNVLIASGLGMKKLGDDSTQAASQVERSQERIGNATQSAADKATPALQRYTQAQDKAAQSAQRLSGASSLVAASLQGAAYAALAASVTGLINASVNHRQAVQAETQAIWDRRKALFDQYDKASTQAAELAVLADVRVRTKEELDAMTQNEILAYQERLEARKQYLQQQMRMALINHEQGEDPSYEREGSTSDTSARQKELRQELTQVRESLQATSDAFAIMEQEAGFSAKQVGLLTDAFVKQRDQSANNAEALKAFFDQLNVDDEPKNLRAIFEAVYQIGVTTGDADQTMEAFTKRLAGLSSKDLTKFITEVSTAYSESEKSSDIYTQGMKAASNALLEQLGLPAKALSSGISKAAQDVLTTLDSLVSSGELKAGSLRQVIEQQLSTLDSPEALVKLIDTLAYSTEAGQQALVQLTNSSAEAERLVTQALSKIDLSAGREEVERLVDSIEMIADTGVFAGESLSKGLGTSLESLDTEQLLEVQRTLQSIARSGTQDLASVQLALSGVTEAAARKLGTSLETLQTGITDAERDAVRSFQTLANAGGLSAEALGRAYTEAHSKIKDPKALQQLEQIARQVSQRSASASSAMASAMQAAYSKTQQAASSAMANFEQLTKFSESKAQNTLNFKVAIDGAKSLEEIRVIQDALDKASAARALGTNNYATAIALLQKRVEIARAERQERERLYALEYGGSISLSPALEKKKKTPEPEVIPAPDTSQLAQATTQATTQAITQGAQQGLQNVDLSAFNAALQQSFAQAASTLESSLLNAVRTVHTLQMQQARELAAAYQAASAVPATQSINLQEAALSATS